MKGQIGIGRWRRGQHKNRRFLHQRRRMPFLVPATVYILLAMFVHSVRRALHMQMHMQLDLRFLHQRRLQFLVPTTVYTLLAMVVHSLR